MLCNLEVIQNSGIQLILNFEKLSFHDSSDFSQTTYNENIWNNFSDIHTLIKNPNIRTLTNIVSSEPIVYY